MNRKQMYALLLIAAVVLVLIFNGRGDVKIDLVFGSITIFKSLAFMVFTTIGVVIGLLLR